MFMAPVNKRISISCLGTDLYYATDYLFASPYWLFFKKTKINPFDTIISPGFLGSPKFIQLSKKILTD